MPTYLQLSQRHPSCDPDRQEDLCALYDGGTRLKKRLDRFLPRRSAEPLERYSLRKNEACYRNYLGPIIDYFAALLFMGKPVAVANDEKNETVLEPGDFYTEFREDCDGNGTDLDAFFKARLVRAMVDGRSWVLLNQSPYAGDDVGALTKAEFDSAKLGDTWLSAIDSADVLDWQESSAGSLEWAIIHKTESRRADPASSRDMVTESWQFLTVAAIETFAVTYDRRVPPKPDDDVPRIGAPVSHRFGRVPVVLLDLPQGLWVANRLETPQLAHFRLSNAQTWGMAATCYAMPVYKVESDSDGKPRMPTMGAGYGLVIGKEESVDWTAPPAEIYGVLGDEIKSHKDEIFRIAHQMALGVENNAAAVGRSADSKSKDAEATRVVMMAFSEVVKETIENVYDLLSAVRGDKFRWAVAGLDDFAAVDVEGLVESLAKLQAAGGVPSRTFQVQMKTRLAEGYLPDIDEKTKADIRKEIEANVGDQIPNMELVELMKAHILAKQLAQGDDGQTQDGAGAPVAPNKKPARPSGNGRADSPPPQA